MLGMCIASCHASGCGSLSERCEECSVFFCVFGILMCDYVVRGHTRHCHSFVPNIRVDGASGVVHGRIDGAADEFRAAVVAACMHGSTRTFLGACEVLSGESCHEKQQGQFLA